MDKSYADKITAEYYENGEDCILEVLRTEAAARERKAIAEHTRQARLPTFKSFKEFDTDFQKSVTPEQLSTLESLESAISTTPWNKIIFCKK